MCKRKPAKKKCSKATRIAVAKTRKDKTVEFYFVSRHGRFGIAWPEKDIDEGTFGIITMGADLALQKLGILKRGETYDYYHGMKKKPTKRKK